MDKLAEVAVTEDDCKVCTVLKQNVEAEYLNSCIDFWKWYVTRLWNWMAELFTDIKETTPTFWKRKKPAKKTTALIRTEPASS